MMASRPITPATIPMIKAKLDFLDIGFEGSVTPGGVPGGVPGAVPGEFGEGGSGGKIAVPVPITVNLITAPNDLLVN